jgi:hypothetical protein
MKARLEVLLYSFFNLEARTGWVTSATPGHFSSGKETRYPLYRRLGGPQGQYGQVPNMSPQSGIRSQDRLACGESLYRLGNRGDKVLLMQFDSVCGS